MTLVKSNQTAFPSIFGNWMDDFFQNDFFGRFPANTQQMPQVNIKETDEAYHLEFAAPGLDKEDFNLKLENGLLTVHAEKEEKQEENEKVHRKEYSYHSFTRTFRLDPNVLAEEVQANYVDGILKIMLPKKNKGENPEAKRIEIS
ncbi:Hsp20/alpha crystallin family protein [Persicobacter diffluens]|uniref:SHSP domain-containing protein n=1 Tax=Persicobacter diffluens TaxID=981 RepID=A0AAN4W0R6_9BACT|nr:hypothetical protein PEDI_23570 [Persicobacter diffluens]